MAAETRVETSGYIQHDVAFENALAEARLTKKIPKGYSVLCHKCEPLMLFKTYEESHNHDIDVHGKIAQRIKLKINEPQPSDKS